MWDFGQGWKRVEGEILFQAGQALWEGLIGVLWEGQEVDLGKDQNEDLGRDQEEGQKVDQREGQKVDQREDHSEGHCKDSHWRLGLVEASSEINKYYSIGTPAIIK